MEKRNRVRQMIAREAARLMYEEGVKEYRDAKRKAAKRFGPMKALGLGSNLPSNVEIYGELRRLIKLHEERALPERLLKLRLLALSYMEMLEPFNPYLVGSVLSGAVTERSDIDLHLFAESVDAVEKHLRARRLPYELEVVTIRKGEEFFEYPHIYLEDEQVIIECTVYSLKDIRRIPRSSITGKPMERANTKKLKKIIVDMAVAMEVEKG
jgi:predicted nucleotidyltransferase